VPHPLDEERPRPCPGQEPHRGGGDAEGDLRPRQTRAEAERQWDTLADALREKQDKRGAFMDASRDDVLACMDFPRGHWTRIAGTNPLERVNREIKRRADVVGILPNDDAIIAPGACVAPPGPRSPFAVGALMRETNHGWTVARPYMSLETLARVTDNPTVRPPAVAT
jgi:putative transposase